MIRIPDILATNQILLNVEAENISDVVTRLGELLKSHSAITNWDGFNAAIQKNAAMSSTAIGNGLCLPHARGNFTLQMVMAVARLAVPLPAKSGSGMIQQVFLICVPHAMSSDHLRLVGALARIFNDESAVSDLLIAPDPTSYLKTLSSEELRLT